MADKTISFCRKAVRFIRGRLCFLFFMLLCLYPVYGKFLEQNIKDLTGVSAAQEEPVLTAESILDGSWQEAANMWLQEHIPGRRLLIRLRNELLYSALHTSPNSSVVIGRDGSLCEGHYLYRWNSVGSYSEASDEELREQAELLADLRDLLRSHGKDLYLLLVPSKPRFSEDVFPWFMDPKDHPDPDEYTRLKAFLLEKDLPVVDGISWMEQNAGLLDSPFFYPTGVHWDTSWAIAVCAQLIERIREDGIYDPGSLSVRAEPSVRIVSSHDDLYQLLNVLRPPRIENYRPVTEAVPGSNVPNVLIRGDSFMYQCFRIPCMKGLFGNYYYLENAEQKRFRPQKGDKITPISSWKAYDEINLRRILARTDLVVLESTEARMADFSMGFAEYLLQNPGLLGQED